MKPPCPVLYRCDVCGGPMTVLSRGKYIDYATVIGAQMANSGTILRQSLKYPASTYYYPK
jgi:hypothetical protein